MVALATEFTSPRKSCSPKTPIGDRVQLPGLRYYNPELGRWVSRDPIGEDGFRKGVATPAGVLPEVHRQAVSGVSRRGRATASTKTSKSDPPDTSFSWGGYLFVQNNAVVLKDLLGMYTLEDCMDEYTKSASDEDKEKIRECVVKCTSVGSVAEVAKCIAGCNLAGNAARVARIGCCWLQIGTESTINPCEEGIGKTVDDPFCFDCREMRVCTQAALGLLANETAIKQALLDAAKCCKQHL